MSHKLSPTYSLLLLLLLLNCIHGGLTLYEGCDYAYNLNAGISYIESPYYPNGYPTRSSCRYQFIAPHDYYIEANCTVNMPSSAGACTTEFLYLSTEGDQLLRDAERFCGQGRFVRESMFRRMAIAYESRGSTGSFRCALNVRPQTCDCGWSITTKIANGQAASENEFPFMAALQDITSNVDSFCGASIMESSRYFDSYAIQRYIKYPGYTDNPPTNDISLLQTVVPIEWSRGVGPICLPPNSTISFNYQYPDVAGWGTQMFAGPTSDALMKANLLVIENSVCQQNYDVTIYTSQICTNDYSGTGRDACQFDSGGPVILRYSRLFLIGCISFGQACGQPYGTGVNTRITYYLNWVRQQTGYTTCGRSLG